ncbi:hypothetical protein CC2G_010969 [Coprinopsis cinerea AmutBmut pab1-1]|nr:hypothetical protein CC2G_010969 [Coprinopsis cinerea AmutBmut pab1-1]
MVNFNSLLPLVRMILFGVVTLLSVIVFALSAHIIDYTRGYGFYWNFAALSLATGILTFLTLPVMYWLSVTRTGAFTSFIVVEVAWLWFLWIMWIASAGSTAAVVHPSAHGGLASEAQAVQAFGFLNWIFLMVYTTTLFVLAIVSHVKGTSAVWTSSVREFDFNTAVNKTAVPPVAEGANPGLAPQFEKQPELAQQQPQQAGYPPQQVPVTPQQSGYAQPPNPGFAGQPVNAVPSSPQV